MLDEIKRNLIANTIKLLVFLNAIFEIRILRTSQGTLSGYFDNPDSVIVAIEPYVGKYDIYFTLNPPDPALLERSHNKLTSYAKQTTADGDIVKLNWLLIDLDPIRKSGTASTKEEKQNARDLVTIVARGLRKDFGFPEPIICDSGNGFHLLYKVDMENTPENVSVLKNLLSALDIVYSTDAAKVDRVTFNPARITKLYGVKTVKGSDSPERPHRWSAIKKIPDEILPVPISAMNRVIDSLPKADDVGSTLITGDTTANIETRKSDTFDFEKWLNDSGLEVTRTKNVVIEGNDATVYILKVCPWNSEHDNHSARITKFKNGGISVGCFHDSCSDKGWHELRDIVEPGWREQVKKKKQKKESGNGDTAFDIIMNICEDFIFFSDQKEEALAQIPMGGNRVEILPVDSGKFRKLVSHKFFLKTKKAFSADAWKQAVGALSGMALFEGTEERLFKRCAWCEGVLYYDLNDKEKRVVRITAEGWDIVQTTDVLFYRHKTMSEQVIPTKGFEDISILDKHYKFKNEDEWVLHTVSLITKFLEHVPHPIDVVHGEKGASKSTTLRKDKSLVDPSRCDIWAMPKTRDDLAILLNNHYFLCFDNLSNITTDMSDLLCQASTGGTYIKRKLHSNNDEMVLDFMQPVSLNGVNMVVTKSDLLDRSLLLELDRLSPTERKTERELWDEFNNDKPLILGLIFDILSKAIKLFPEIKLDKLGRMADFTLWGFAIAEAAGIGGAKFMEAYLRNQNKANDEAVASHPIAYAIVKFMEGKTEWIGTASELLKKLGDIADKEEIDTKSYLWVKQPNQLSRRIREVKSNLEQMGLEIEIKSGGGSRQIKIRNNNQ